MIKGEKLFEYLNMFAQEMLSKGNNGLSGQQAQQAQQAQQQAMGQREERVERMNMPQQQQQQQQQPGSNNSNELGDFEGWCDDGGCSIGFSMISKSNDDHQNSKLQQNDSMFYLDQNESLTGSLNPGGPSAVQTGSTNDDFQKSAKRSEMDQAYEKMMDSRR